MQKSLCAIIVVLLSFIGAHAMAAKLDMNVHKSSSQTSDTSTNDNYGGKQCGSMSK